jgi:UDP-GlcNAc:undecaprenyl-phosphate/decaprenyl-phosphate GlcNAc-1-phosphate transferase
VEAESAAGTVGHQSTTLVMTLGPSASALVAVLVGLSLGPAVLWMLRRGLVLDVPNERSSHQAATPRGGGLATLAACVVAAAVSSQLTGPARVGMLMVAVGMGGIGLLDDVRGLGPLPRLAGQAVIAGAGMVWLTRSLGGPDLWRVAFSAGVVVWVVAFVNAFNFMDGINGISVAQVVVAGVAWWAIGRIHHIPDLTTAGLVVAGAGVAFAPFNVPRARMFLGDVGSYFLGGWLAAAAVVGVRSGVAPEAVLSPLVLYGADTLTTLVRRARRHQAWYRPHREHAYQRLVRLGWSHTRTSLAVAITITMSSLFGAVSLTGSLPARMVGDALAACVVCAYLASPSLIERRRGNGALLQQA